MRTRLSLFCDKIIEAGGLMALVIVPLFFNIYSQRVFEPDKLSLLRSIALVMGVAWIVRLVEDWRSAREEPAANRPAEPAVSKTPFWRRALRTPLVLPTLLLILIYLVSTALSVVPRVSFWGSYQRLQGTYTTLSYIIIFFLMVQGLRTKRQLNRVITTIILTSFPIALYGLVQHFALDPLPWGGNVTYRVASNMGNAIFVAAYLIMIVPLTLSRLLENWKEAVGKADALDAGLGALAFAVLVGSLLAGMLIQPSGSGTWLRWVALLVGLGLQIPIYLLTPAGRRNRVLTIALPLSFAFLVGFSWVLELLFPPATSNYFWLGLMAVVIFGLAMAAFAYYLRRPIARLLLLAGYFSILIAQVICIFYTQSRGPLLGFLAGMLFFVALIGLIRRQVWLSWASIVLAVVVGGLLVIFNTVDSPAINQLRETRYIGRLGKVLQTESGTGKVRVLIWEGVTEMIDWHEPLQIPGEETQSDPFNAIRPLIGYGPESMYVAYNRFYPPDLAHYEKRNASPDRSHNETFDALVTTGAIGFVIYMFLFSSVFYFGLKWLGFIQVAWHKWAFLGCWIAGGVLGAIGAWAWRGPVYVGVGIPGGVIGGLAVYLFTFIVHATADRHVREAIGGRYALWILALLAAIVAHFVEIHFGIAIASTRTYFWVYAAMMVVIGTRLAVSAHASEEQATPATGTAGALAAPVVGVRRRRRHGAAPAPAARVPAVGARDWLGSVLVLSLIGLLILSTMLFNLVTIQEGYPGAFTTLWKSLTVAKGDPARPVMLALFLSTWAMIGLLGLADLAMREEGERMQLKDWLRALGLYMGLTLGGAFIYGMLHAVRLRPVTISTLDAPNPVANTITFYYVAAFVLLLCLAAILTFAFQRTWRAAPTKSRDSAGPLGVGALAVVLAIVAFVVIYATNVTIVRADILYKQGLSSEKAKQWDGAIYFYQKAIDLAKDQDFYYLFLGRAYMEKGRAATGTEQETWLGESQEALQKARDIAPLNTDHSANLARLYRTWGSLSTGEQQSQRLGLALDFYEEATDLSPNNAQLFNEWGQTYAALGDYEQAKAKYQKSLTLDDRFEQTYQLVGELAMQQKNWEDARTAYEQALKVNLKSATTYSALGYVYTQLGEQQAALEAYQQAVQLSPKNFNNRKNLAILYQQMGLFPEAIAEATEALALAPEAQKQQMETFLAQLQRQQAAPSAEDAQKALALVEEGRVQMDAQQWITAEATFSQAITFDPTNAQAHSALAYVLAKQGKTEQAIAENLLVVSLAPTDWNSHKNLAILYQQTGDVVQALSEAELALSQAPDTEKEALQAYVDQLTALQPESAAPSEKASDLPAAERNDMYTEAPSMTIDPNKTYEATIVTAKGNIVISLNAKDAPQTVNNFVTLARQGFYDGLTFHRVENQTGFVLIQGGDPLGTGTGGPGYTVPAEIGLLHNEGAIAMARLGDQANPQRASSGSQFYICLVPIHQLDGAYTVFGYVVQGLDVAKKIAKGDQMLSVVIVEK